MKILSLNVHQFLAVYPEEGSWQKEIIAVVKLFLQMEPDGVVFLYEIPNRYYRTNKLEALFGSCYHIEYSPDSGFFFSIAIQKNNGGWSHLNDFPCGANYRNRYVERQNEQFKLRVLGLHAPLEHSDSIDPATGRDPDVYEFFENVRAYAETHSGKRTVILGDMNVHSEMPCVYYDIFQRIRAKGGLDYTDLVKDETPTYFPNGHTLDHVLVSPELKDKVTVKVYAQDELELSDHAVIVVDISV